jgi:SAM-dependent methyltransferase
MWHDRDEFWEKLAPFLFPKERWELTAEEVDCIIELLELEQGAHILDLCCGPGRHTLEFNRRGHPVVGVDRTAAYIQQALKKAKSEGLNAEFVHDDMRQFIRTEAFDVAILMFTSFGYFEAHEENIRVIENVWASLRDGGRVLIDVMGKEVLARIFQPQGWEERDGVFWLQERNIFQNWSKIENRWIVIGEGEQFEINFRHWLYSAVELAGMLQGAGFGKVDCYGDLRGSEYGAHARRLVCVGVK